MAVDQAGHRDLAAGVDVHGVGEARREEVRGMRGGPPAGDRRDTAAAYDDGGVLDEGDPFASASASASASSASASASASVSAYASASAFALASASAFAFPPAFAFVVDEGGASGDDEIGGLRRAGGRGTRWGGLRVGRGLGRGHHATVRRDRAAG
jgi:hypothetical protein